MKKPDLTNCVTMKVIDGATILKRVGQVPHTHCRYVIEYLGFALRECSKYEACVTWLKDESRKGTGVTIISGGDKKAGIPDMETTVQFDFNLLEDHNLKDRTGVRIMFDAMFSTLHDSPVAVLFSDECPDCGALGYRFGICCNVKQCPSHQPCEEVI